MISENIFEYAASHKLRFPYKGQVAVEDLYDLSVKELDSIYKTLKREDKKEDEESLLVTHSSKDVAIAIKIEIVKFIVNRKLEQDEKNKKSAENRAKRQQIAEILAKKRDDKLQNMSEEALLNMLSELED